jgi:hypothetical protein
LHLDAHALLAHSLLVKHIIRLVQDENSDLLAVELASPDQIHGRSRRADDNLSIDGLPTLACLNWNGRGHFEALDELPHDLDHADDLTRELPSWCKHQCLRRFPRLRRGQIEPR